MKKSIVVLIGSIALASSASAGTLDISPLFAGAVRAVPDGGTTILLLSGALTAIGLLRRKFRR
ncbi:MAG TPA: VPDSG-CTERM sorting domain-containing protein [Candidatus Polarisedimenticolia bacterium]|nr:VPDSG-CTERM sorting domain-containing protein [Candidatus Polarisedimenticolia bacterium]